MRKGGGMIGNSPNPFSPQASAGIGTDTEKMHSDGGKGKNSPLRNPPRLPAILRDEDVEWNMDMDMKCILRCKYP